MNQILGSLLKTREQKLALLQEKTRARDEAVGAIQLCKQLRESLPARIKEGEQELVDPSLSTMYAAEEDAVADEMITRMEGLTALRRLLRDLPEIQKHWENRLLALTGGNGARG
jgi:hypothetical protein